MFGNESIPAANKEIDPTTNTSLRKKATIHQVMTMLATAKNVYFQVITTC